MTDLVFGIRASQEGWEAKEFIGGKRRQRNKAASYHYQNKQAAVDTSIIYELIFSPLMSCYKAIFQKISFGKKKSADFSRYL
jgi:hypothetical protein